MGSCSKQTVTPKMAEPLSRAHSTSLYSQMWVQHAHMQAVTLSLHHLPQHTLIELATTCKEMHQNVKQHLQKVEFRGSMQGVEMFQSLAELTAICNKQMLQNLPMLARVQSLKVLELHNASASPYPMQDLHLFSTLRGLHTLRLHNFHLTQHSGLHTLANATTPNTPWEQPRGLQTLMLNYCNIDVPSLLQLFTDPDAKGADSSETTPTKSSFCKQLHTLEVVGLTLPQGADSGVPFYGGLKQLQAVTKLVLRACDDLSDDLCAEVSELPKLQYLDLSRQGINAYCALQSITDAGVRHLNRLTRLQTLMLGGHMGLSHETPSLLRALAHSLRDLDIRQPVPLIPFTGHINSQPPSGLRSHDITQTLQFLPCLERVTLGGAAVSNGSMRAVAALESLTALQLVHCEKLTDAGMFLLQPLTQLKELRIVNCNQVTDIGVARLIKACSRLRTVQLSYLDNATALGVRELQGRPLRDLDLSGISKLTHEVVSAIILECPYIEHLNLQDCNGITDITMLTISMGLKSLKTLNVQYCENVTPAGLRAVRRLLDLEQVNVYGCSGMHKVVKSDFPGIEVVCEKPFWWTKSPSVVSVEG